MQIQVKLFAVARQLAGREELTLTLRAAARVADVRRALVEQRPELAPLGDYLLFAVDREYAGDDVLVNQDSEIAVIPPVSGG